MNAFFKKTALFSLTAAALLMVSCNKNDDGNNGDDTVNFSAENTAFAAQADNIAEGALNLAESGYVQIEEPGRMASSLFPDCVSITLSTSGPDTIILLTFGTDDGDGNPIPCELYNGAVVSGQIEMTCGQIFNGSRFIYYDYLDFTYNGNAITGGGTINRTIENAMGFPESSVDESITIAFTGTSVTGQRDAIRIAQWVEGVGSGTWADNVYEIEGNWQTTLSNGFERTGMVTQTLVKKLACLYFVSGEIEVTQEGLTGSIDFGDGVCDPFASIFFNGQEFPIILGN